MDQPSFFQPPQKFRQSASYLQDFLPSTLAELVHHEAAENHVNEAVHGTRAEETDELGPKFRLHMAVRVQ